MTAELIERLRKPYTMSMYAKSEHLYDDMRKAMDEAAAALEQQARELAEVRARTIEQVRQEVSKALKPVEHEWHGSEGPIHVDAETAAARKLHKRAMEACSRVSIREG